jgi:hypothetical protein
MSRHAQLGYNHHDMSDEAEHLFVVGARYRVLRDETALRDVFRRGQRLLYWRHAYSFYDGLHGWFFLDDSGAVLAWDLPDVDVAARDTLFALDGEPSALIKACADGDARLAREAIARSPPGRGERRLAFERSCESSSPDCLRLLLDVSGVDDEERRSFFHEGAGRGFTDGVRLLLDAGVPVDSTDSSGQSALLHAATAGALDTVELLLSRGADRALCTRSGKTAEEMAAAFHREAVVERLRRNP